MPKKTQHYIYYSLLLVVIVSFFAYLTLVRPMAAKYDLVFAIAYQHGNSLYFQSIIYLLVFLQVLVVRKVSAEIATRRKTKTIIIKLAALIGLEWLIYGSVLFLSYYLFKSHSFIKMGDPKLGSMIILMHLSLMLFLMLAILLAYKIPFPYLVLVFAVAITSAYHYQFELTQFLPKYNPIFDPLYQAIHHIYL